MNKSFFIKCLCAFSLVMTISLDASAATTCKAGYYLKNNKCVICPAGQISAEGAYKSCTTCPAGQYEKSHKVCIRCEAGKYCLDGKKKPCPAGSYCPAGSSEPTACTGNQYTTSSGQKTYKVCDGKRQIVNEKHTGCKTCPSDQDPNAEHTACVGKIKKCTANHGAKTPTACGADKPICNQNTGVCQVCLFSNRYSLEKME